MVDLVKLLDFAKEYYYTKNEEKIKVKEYLNDIVYVNGSVDLYSGEESRSITQKMDIIFKDSHTIVLDFNFLPLEQELEILIDNVLVSSDEYTRVVDSVTLNDVYPHLYSKIYIVTVRVRGYTGNDGLIYRGLQITKYYLSIFANDYSASITYNSQMHKWILTDNNGTGDVGSLLPYLKCSEGVTLTKINDNYLEVVFPLSKPCSFVISRDDDENGYSYHPVNCQYLGNSFRVDTI